MTLKQATDELPLNHAFALVAWHMEAHPFASVERVGDGYIAQEAYRTYKPK